MSQYLQENPHNFAWHFYNLVTMQICSTDTASRKADHFVLFLRNGSQNFLSILSGLV